MGNVVDFQAVAQEDVRIDLREMFLGAIRASLEMLLEEEVKNLVGASRYERVGTRKGQRNGSYLRGLLTSMGHIDVCVPRTREHGSPVDLLGRYQRRTEGVDAMLTEAYVQGVSQRKMAGVTKELMGEAVGRSTVSRVAKRLQQTVEELRTQPIQQEFPYLYLDATFIDARWARQVENVSALVAYGVGQDGHRHLLGVHIGLQESEESWAELLGQLLDRQLRGVRLIISDEHKGLKKACRRLLPEARHQRCTVHLQRNVLSKVRRQLQSRIAHDVAEIFKATSRKEAEKRRDAFCAVWSKDLPEAVECLKDGFVDATQFYAFPVAHHRRIRTTNSLERLHREIKRRVNSVGAFPDRESALRLVTAVAIKTCATWGDRRYLDMELLKESAKQAA